METPLHPQLVATVQKLIHAGCHYDLDGLAASYAPDLQIVMIQPDGSLARFNYAQNMAFFKNLRDSDAAPLNTAAVFRLAEVQDGTGYVVVERTMNLGGGEQRIVFSLMLRETGGQWQVFREHAVVCGKALRKEDCFIPAESLSEYDCFKEMPAWSAQDFPNRIVQVEAFARLQVDRGEFVFRAYDEQDNVVYQETFNANNQQMLLRPNVRHTATPMGDIECRLQLFRHKG